MPVSFILANPIVFLPETGDFDDLGRPQFIGRAQTQKSETVELAF